MSVFSGPCATSAIPVQPLVLTLTTHLDNSPWLFGAAGCRALEVPQSPEAHDCGGGENRAGQEQGEFKALEK